MSATQVYRAWLVACPADWQPERWDECPPTCIALEPAEMGYLLADEVNVFVRSFNTAMLRHPKRIWAVAVPVTLQFVGDLVMGQQLDADQVQTAAACRAGG